MCVAPGGERGRTESQQDAWAAGGIGAQCRPLSRRASAARGRRCGRHRAGLYDECKAACDAYFYLPARAEHRGIGGVFFDDLAAGAEGGLDAEAVRCRAPCCALVWA